MQFIRGALDFFEVVPQSPRYRLLDSVWFSRHTRPANLRQSAEI